MLFCDVYNCKSAVFPFLPNRACTYFRRCWQILPWLHTTFIPDENNKNSNKIMLQLARVKYKGRGKCLMALSAEAVYSECQ